MNLILSLVDGISILFATEFYLIISGIIVFIAICNIIKNLLKGV